MSITTENVIELLEKAVEIKGADYVYPAGECFYSNRKVNPEPMCIVGYVLADEEPELFSEVAERESRESLSCGIMDFEDWDIALPIDFKTTNVLYAAQRVQDNGGTWGTALEAAKARLAEINVYKV